MADTKELTLFIPGIGAGEPEEYLERLTNGIKGYCQGRGLRARSLEDSGQPGTGRRNIEVEAADGSTKSIDIWEVYWGDLRPLLSSQSIMRKVVRGFSLLIFWVSSAGTWRRALNSKFMMFNMAFTLILILIWYYGALAAGLTAVGSNTEFLGHNLPAGFANWFGTLGDSMGSWYVWGIAAVVMGLVPATEVIDISYASRAYLQNRRGMRYRVCGRVANALADAGRSQEGAYDRITVLSHSFGVVVGTEVLADYTSERAPGVRVISLGGPLLLISARSERVRRAVSRVMANDRVEAWLDFYSDQDWLCTKSPVADESRKFRSHKITATVSLDEKLSGKSHSLYFDDWDVIEALLA